LASSPLVVSIVSTFDMSRPWLLRTLGTVGGEASRAVIVVLFVVPI
jgi:hypothetical protein